MTAAKRPKNSALEVDLDFEHNARPAPVITEEVTASLEELIRNRIIEVEFVLSLQCMLTECENGINFTLTSYNKAGTANLKLSFCLQIENNCYAFLVDR